MASGAVIQYSLSGIAHAAPTDRIEVYGSEGVLIYDMVADTRLSTQMTI